MRVLSAPPALVLYTLLLLTLAACTPGLYVATPYQDWTEAVPPLDGLVHRAFLIGDAGPPDAAVLALLKAQLDTTGERGTVVFLGDNVQPDGLPGLTDEDRAAAEAQLQAQLDVVRDFPGQVVFVPGEHDWRDDGAGGLAAVRRQEQFIETALDRGNVFLPDDGFPGPVRVKLTDRIILVALDTQWWLTDEQKPFGDTGDYDLEETGDFLLELDDLVKRHDDKDLLVVGHHPMYSIGDHSGRAPLREHIFPLTALGAPLYVPVPLLGSLVPLHRRYIGGPQDLAHPRYAALRRNMISIFDQHEDPFLIYASGHDHSLQYFPGAQNMRHYVVSGSGSTTGYVASGGEAAFAAAEPGFAVVNYYEDGAVWLEFWTPADTPGRGRLLFRTALRERLPELVDPGVPDDADRYPDYTDSTIVVAANPNYGAGSFKTFWLGEHNRDAWTTPVEVPVLDLGRTAGGLTPTKRGGGMQTRSLRLEGADGQEYVLRSIDKDPTKTVPENLQGSVATDLVQDQIAALHPYGAFIVPRLARAAGVYHTNPRLVFVPDDPRLGIYREGFGGQLMMFEDRPDDDMSHQPSYGNTEEVVSSSKLYREVTEDNDHRVDQAMYVRSRLFDILLSDWDRHRDQWRWAAFEPYELDPTLEGEARTQGKIYRPIPRDRDWAFNHMNGVLPSVYKQIDPRFQSFGEDYGFLRGFTINGGTQDRRFTNALTREDWLAAADSIRRGLTDEVIEAAVHDWPEAIVAIDGEETIRTLKLRRDKILDVAARLYELYAEKADIVGSNKHERFEVTRLDDDRTEVVVHKLDGDGEVQRELYRRVFLRDETEEIRLYGLDGEDQFVVSGVVRDGIRVIAVGGVGEDTFVDRSSVAGSARMTEFYDTDDGNDWEVGPETRAVRSADPAVNVYDEEGYLPDLTLPKTFFGANKDDGVFIGGGIQKIRQGFREYPYAASHTFLGNFAVKTLAFNLRYEGVFNAAVADWDLGLQLDYLSPNSIRNYYGLGNETENERDDRTFYQARLTTARAAPFLARQLDRNVRLRVSPQVEFVRVREDEDRFLSDPQAGIAPGTFGTQWFAGIDALLVFGLIDNPVYPRQGFQWSNHLDWNVGLSAATESFTALASDFTFYLTPYRFRRWTVAGRIGGEHNVGAFPFFYASTLGGRHNLRGYRSTRFAGRTSFYQNVDLRIHVFNYANYIAIGQFGVLGFFDNGRVWTDGETSNIWHHGYGGGIWATFFDAFLVSSMLGFSDDDTTITVKLGFQF